MRQDRIAFVDTLDHDHVGLHEATSINQRSILEARLAGKPLRMRIHVPSVDAVCRMAQAGMGVSIVLWELFLTTQPASAFPDYPATVEAGGLLFVSGVRPAEEASGFDALPVAGRGKQQGFAIADLQEGEASAQAWSMLQRMDAVLCEAGSSQDQILRQHIWQADKRWFPCFEKARMHWQPKPSPSSGLGVGGMLGRGGSSYGSDAIAALPGRDGPFAARTTLAAPDHRDLPSASHYAQAVQSGPLVFTARFSALT